MKYSRHIFYKLIILSLFFIFCYSIETKQHEKIIIDKTIFSSIREKGYNYYLLSTEEFGYNNNMFLIINLEINNEKKSYNILSSNPNLYISTKNEFPTIKENNWSFEKYGEELAIIDNSYLKNNKIFYIGVYCENNCDYKLTAKFLTNYPIKENKLYEIKIKRNSSLKLSFTSKEQFNKLLINCFTTDFLGQLFNFTLIEKNEGNQKILNNLISYKNGYKYLLNKEDINYKQNQTYEILIENYLENEDIEIILWLEYDDKEINLVEGDILLDNINKGQIKCFNYKLDKNYENLNLVLSMNINNGQGILFLNGWNSITSEDKNYNNIIKRKEDIFNILFKKTLLINKENYFNRFDQNYFNNNNKNLHFCFYANEESSYSLKLYYIENSEKLQVNNYIISGISEQGVLLNNTITKYNLDDFNILKDTEIELNNLIGNAKLYIYFNTEDINIITMNKFNNLKENKRLLEGFTIFNGEKIIINKEINQCLHNKDQFCQIFVLVECKTTNTKECLFNIKFEHSDEEIIMKPKNIYENVIAQNEVDKFIINIKENNIKNLTIVLNQNSGKIILKVKKFCHIINGINHEIVIDKEQFTNEYLPNVIKINNEELNLYSLKGIFYIEVFGQSFGDYTIYYYINTQKENEIIPPYKNVLMNLHTGKIIQDYFFDEYIKVYAYDNTFLGRIYKPDLHISITKSIGLKCNLYIFKDLNDFSNENGQIKGYLWESNYYNYIHIYKTDKNYIFNGVYYIMVVKDHQDENYKKNNNENMFYLGITDEDIPYTLNNGMEFRQILTEDHIKQNFYFNYLYNNTLNEENKEFQLSLTVYSGQINIDLKINGKHYMYQKITYESQIIKIKKEELIHYCNINNLGCGIEIEINLSLEYSKRGDFLITCQSSSNLPIFLKPGNVNSKSMINDEEHYFIVESYPDKNIGIRINVLFNTGRGEIYARKILKQEITQLNNLDPSVFPNINNYEYTNQNKINDFNNKQYLINIPYDDLKDMNPCFLLVTIKGHGERFYFGKIEYTISVSNKINEIVVNKNYRLFISSGEVTIFHFTITNNKKRIYISMTNKDEDAIMYLNYDNSNINIDNYRWRSSGAYNEYLDISIHDTLFAEKRMKYLDGEYYLAIQGLGTCFYNLYVSCEDVKIISISEDFPGGCGCDQAGDKCYFRYENINDPSFIKPIEKELFIYLHYTYGSGKIFGKLYENGNMENIINNLPTSSSYDYLSIEDNEFMKIKLEEINSKYTIESVLVLSVECKEKSLFDLNILPLKKFYNSNINELSELNLKINKNNIFYLTMNQPVKLTYYIEQNEDLYFEARTYYGNANIHSYLNSTGKLDYRQISDFELIANEIEPYFKKIDKNIGYNKNAYFEVTPKSKDVIFYINLKYNNQFTRLDINKEIHSSLSLNQNYYSYFDFMEEFDEVILTLVEHFDNDDDIKSIYKGLNVYIKSNLIDISSNETIKYSLPSETNYDLKGTTNILTDSVSIKLRNLNKEAREINKKKLRVYISVSKDSLSLESKFSLIVTPIVFNYNRVKLSQNTYYYSNINIPKKDIDLFILKKNKKEDDLIVIEISNCFNDNIDFYVTTEVPKDIFRTENKIKTIIKKMNGKQIILIEKPENIEYYLIIWKTNNIKNKEDAKILYNYYSINKNNFKYFQTNDLFTATSKKVGKVILNLPEIKQKDLNGNEYKNVDEFEYYVIITQDFKEFNYLENTCFLSVKYDQLKNNKFYEKNKINIIINKENNVIELNGLQKEKTYYVNILIKNTETDEIIGYQPLQIKSAGYNGNVILIILLTFIFLIVICCIFYYAKQYKVLKKKVDFQANDIKSLTSIPRTLENIKEIDQNYEEDLKPKSTKIKYANI